MQVMQVADVHFFATHRKRLCIGEFLVIPRLVSVWLTVSRSVGV